MEEKLVIDASRVDPAGEELAGEVDCVDICESLVKPFGGVRYSFFVQPLGSEMLVRGTLEQDFDLVCSRCGKDFDTTIHVNDFTESYLIDPKSPEIDVTEDVRQSVLLNLPTYPVCSETCPGVVCADKKPADDRWNVLDCLKKSK